jgi:hypothetical protein
VRSQTINAITLPIAVLGLIGQHTHILSSQLATLIELPWLLYWLITVFHWAWTGEILWRVPMERRHPS